MMLTSLILQLQAPSAAVLPASLGRAGLALFLRLIGERDPALAQELHDLDGPKPFTASNLVLGKRAQGSLRIESGQTGWLRFSGLSRAVSEGLQALAVQPPEMVELDGYRLRVTEATLDPARHPWAGQVSYQDLAAPYLLGGRAQLSSKIGLAFVSPTTFRSGGRFVPLPAPELVFGSLLDRWQAFAPVALHPETRRFAAEAVAVSRFELRTRGVPYVKASEAGRNGPPPAGGKVEPAPGKAGSVLIGFTGQVVYTVLNRDRYWLNVLHLLAAFAFYSGVGYQTGVGLGQVRKVEEKGSKLEDRRKRELN
ncbi:MAG: CRISPR system precrRNA processing endoribonuclease RAMP protein Cas6 [Anaerolineales bacterium]|nr:CRISPR system precrRNA processing endoribonuclease RAMP protein Cas6 [Anaerolineales bacterium]